MLIREISVSSQAAQQPKSVYNPCYVFPAAPAAMSVFYIKLRSSQSLCAIRALNSRKSMFP